MQTIILASGNPGKLREFQDLLKDLGCDVKAQSDYKVSSVPETGTTFVENAIIKARHACAETGLPAIADDSGIEVDALKGRPGIYSARYAGPDAGDENNNDKLLEELASYPEAEQRTARYQCVLVYMQHKDDPTPVICQGSWEGTILHERVGKNGFGYDPLFFVPEKNCSSAELDKDIKNGISHRGKAMAELLEKIKPLLG